MKIYNVNSVGEKLTEKLQKCQRVTPPRGRKTGGSRGKKYVNAISAFDIETSDNGVYNWLYIWQSCIDDIIITGRTWEEFDQLLTIIKEAIADDETFVFYVHNLSYEFQYLKGVYDFHATGSRDDTVFMMDDRKVLKCTVRDNIEFRCSALLTNMGLGAFTKKMGVEHQKLDGDEFDYSEIRYPWTELTEEQLHYCINDVVGLVEALKVKFSLTSETLATIPYTSTGYVRRDAKFITRKIRKAITTILPDEETYTMLRYAFRGGNTHANRYCSNVILDNVMSYDRSSSYPDVMVNCRFPTTPFKKVKITDLYKVDCMKKNAYVIDVDIYDVRVKEDVTIPYLCMNDYIDIEGATYDNGRVLVAKHMHMCITDIDLAIILKQYNFTYHINKAITSKYGMLPKCLRELCIAYYKNKTGLKDVKGKELEYSLHKALLNAIYGMMAQDPAKQTVLFDGNEASESNKEVKELLNSKGFKLPYQWGVWVSAWGRYRLQNGIDIADLNGRDTMVYCDTDSVKLIKNEKSIKAFKELNKKLLAESKKNGAYATDPQGRIHYMGVYECETEKEPNGTYEKFKTMGAKRYAYVDQDGLHITVAGVNKKDGAKELKTIENFKEGYLFEKSGKTSASYCDEPDCDYLLVDGKRIRITPFIIIKEVKYLLSLTNEYKNILEYIAN
jgi:hypothetical protein